MIARKWRGWAHTNRIEEYVDIVERTGMAGYLATPGNRGAQLLTRDLGDARTELITLSWWDDLDRIAAFAGADIETAKLHPTEGNLEDEAAMTTTTTRPFHRLTDLIDGVRAAIAVQADWADTE